MHIGTRHIGPGNPPYIIAEIGVNHDGSVDRALDLVRAASDANADAIKLQYFQTDRLLSTAAKLAAYQRTAGETDPIAMLRRLELSLEQMAPVVALAHELDLHAIVTVFSLELVNPSTQLPFDAYKSASPDLINRPLLDAMASTNKPFILSTGASTLDEIKRTLAWLTDTPDHAHDQLALLHCVSSYPTPPDRAALEGIAALAALFPGPVGYSDHTAAVETAARAVVAGAHILEKHLTYSQNAEGPDHAASLNPDQFRAYAALARTTFHQRSQQPTQPNAPTAPDQPAPQRTVLDIEQDVRTVARQSLTTTRALEAGHRLTRADLTIKRPGVGIEPHHLDVTVGCQLAHTVQADTPLKPTDLQA